jgi:hypothetical protein
MKLTFTKDDEADLKRIIGDIAKGLPVNERLYLALCPNGTLQMFYSKSGIRDFEALPLFEFVHYKRKPAKVNLLAEIARPLFVEVVREFSDANQTP